MTVCPTRVGSCHDGCARHRGGGCPEQQKAARCCIRPRSGAFPCQCRSLPSRRPSLCRTCPTSPPRRCPGMLALFYEHFGSRKDPDDFGVIERPVRDTVNEIRCLTRTATHLGVWPLVCCTAREAKVGLAALARPCITRSAERHEALARTARYDLRSTWSVSGCRMRSNRVVRWIARPPRAPAFAGSS